VSTPDQEREGYSIPAQMKLLEDYAALNGIIVASTHVDVETAKKAERTAFGEMLRHLHRDPDIGILLVEKTDRLYRNLKDWAIIDDLGIEVHFVKEIRRVWVQAVSLALADFGLPASLISALILASRHGDKGVRQNALAEEVGVNPGGMVRILDQAEAANLLERRDSPDDRRIKTIHVMPKGRDLAKKMEKAVTRLRDDLLGDLPSQDIETTTRTLRLFEERIGQFLQQARTGR
jgi:MarR family transcriptional regulator for hemolysin